MIVRALLLLLATTALAVVSGRSHAQASATPPPAGQAEVLAYLLDRDLGPALSAQRHLLAWRLLSALNSGEFTPGSAVTETLLKWQENLDSLDRTAATDLPAWFAPVADTLATDMVLSFLADAQYAPWHRSQRMTTAARLANLLTGPAPPRWALAAYPQLLSWARDHAPWIWAGLLGYLADNPDWSPLLQPTISRWTAAPASLEPESAAAREAAAAAELKSLGTRGDRALALLADEADLLNSEGLLVDRFRADRQRQAVYRLYGQQQLPSDLDLGLLALSRALAGVEQGHFVQLIEVLAGVAEIVLLQTAPDEASRMQRTIEILRSVDPIVVNQLVAVDPDLQAIYLQLRSLLSDANATPTTGTSLKLLASLRSALRMDAVDLEGYRSQPMRSTFENDLMVCFDISRLSGPRPREPIALSQYRSCQTSFLRWAVENAASPELAGDPSGPFEAANLARELDLSQWQRVNYWAGYLANRVGAGCQVEMPLVNPLEWSLAANAYIAFAQRWPAYFNLSDAAVDLDRILERGQQLVQALTSLARCGSPATPLLAAVDEYAQALDDTVTEIAAATESFRKNRLVPGADIRLDEGAWQVTNYRPEDLQILPCGGEPKCNMSLPLMPSRALYSLLPTPFLVADQARVGALKMCYDEIRWQDRRAQKPRVGDPAMARYFGRLSFELHALLGGLPEPILSMRLTSDDEYEYLFGENSARVLDDACPRELIGTQVQAQMPDRMLNLVPRRLTYMTADRADPAKILSAHWASGKEWRDRFVTGEGVEILASQPAEVVTAAVDARLSDLFVEWNAWVYDQLVAETGASSLTLAMNRLDTDRRLVSTMAKLVAPRQGVDDAATRAALLGRRSLFDRSAARQVRQQNVPVSQIPALALGHFEDARYLFSSVRSDRVVVDPLVVSTLARLAALRLAASTSEN